MSIYVKYDEKSGLPACWVWAWRRMPKVHGMSYSSYDCILYHDEHKRVKDPITDEMVQMCPHCVDYSRILSYKQRTKW